MVCAAPGQYQEPNMIAVLRGLGSIVVALLLAIVLVIAVELYSAVVHPFSADFDAKSMEQMCQHVARYPQWVLATVVPMWAGTAWVSTWLAGRIGNRGAAIFVGLLLLVGALFNVVQLPYPLWFKIVMPLAILLAIVAAALGAGRRKSAAESTNS